MADFGFKISKEGFDVLTTADKNLVFSSEFNTFKRRTFGNTNLTISSFSTNTTSVSHNIGSRPAFLVYYKDNNGNYLIDYSNFVDSFTRRSSNMYLEAKTDTSDIIFTAYNDTVSQETITIYYELFYELI